MCFKLGHHLEKTAAFSSLRNTLLFFFWWCTFSTPACRMIPNCELMLQVFFPCQVGRGLLLCAILNVCWLFFCFGHVFSLLECILRAEGYWSCGDEERMDFFLEQPMSGHNVKASEGCLVVSGGISLPQKMQHGGLKILLWGLDCF